MKNAGFKVYDWYGQTSTGVTINEIGEAKIYNPAVLKLREKASAMIDAAKNIVNKLYGKEKEQKKWNRNVNIINNYLGEQRKRYGKLD